MVPFPSSASVPNTAAAGPVRSPTPLKFSLAPLSESEAEALRIVQTWILLLECDWVVNLSSFPLPDCHPWPWQRQRQTWSGPIIIKEVHDRPTDRPTIHSVSAPTRFAPPFFPPIASVRQALLSSPLRSFTSVIKMPRPLSSSPRTIRPPRERGRERVCCSSREEKRAPAGRPPIGLSVPHLY